MIFIKILVLLIPYASAVLGIQVYENITNDVTTSPTKLVIVPTPITKRDEPVTTSPHILNSNATSSTSTKDRNTMNSSVTPTSHEKSSRKKEKGNNEEGRNASLSKVEQHEKTSSNIKHEKFVPSPEISLSGIEIQSQPAIPPTNDNFYPINQFRQPVKHSVHFHSSSPIISNSEWRHSTSLESLQKNYPKFEDEVQQHKESEKFNWPSNEDSKWFLMPEKPITEKPSRPSGKWKWVSDEEEQEKRIIPSKFPSIPSHEFSYTFEIPTTDSTPFSFGSTKNEETDEQSIVEPPESSTTLGTLESEWEGPFTSSNGKLKHKTKGGGTNVSPWKKILHVLTAAIPIGLLISALTPQVIYVDPNATSSMSSSNSLGLQSTSKYRSLDRFVSPETSKSAEYENGRKFLSNPLMDFLHILRDNGNSVERTDSCDDRKFCEASRSGADPNANVLNKMLWKIANETPEFQAKKSGLENIFQAIRSNNCSIFECKKQESYNQFGRN